jgi:pimeloyl-ACP methyl ester carboxylesterase
MLLVLVCGALCNAQSFGDLLTIAQERGLETKVLIPNIISLNGSYRKDLETFRGEISALAATNKEMIFAGYSGGGKFAARLAMDFPVKGLFFMDPVDGPPPRQTDEERFPTLLKEVTPAWRTLLSKETPAKLFILKSDKGELPGFGNIPCAPKEKGTAWFQERLGAAVEETELLENAGHLEFMSKGPAWPLTGFCPGSGDKSSVLARTASAFSNFLDSVSAN